MYTARPFRFPALLNAKQVGTGQQGTQPGYVYLAVPVSKQEEVSWVFMKEKLFLRTQSLEPGSI